MQLVIDGLFHALMHVVLVAGVTLMIKTRPDLALGKANSYLRASMLIGFGLGCISWSWPARAIRA